MKNRHISILATLIVLMSTPVYAKTITLQECLEKARQNNPALKTAAWDTAIAREGVRQASSALFPRADAQAGYTMQQAAQAVKINGIKAETQEPDYAFGGLSASYTIYDFGRRDARIERARSLADSTSMFYDARRSDVYMQVIEAYFGILEAGKLIEAAKDEVTQVEEHLRTAQALFEEGVVTRNDVLQAEVRLAAARQNLLVAQNRRENIWLQMNFLTGADPATHGELEENASMTADMDNRISTDSAIAHRSEIQALQKSVEAGEANLKESRSNFYPELYTRLALDYVQNDKVNEQTIMSATVGLKVNLFDGFASTSGRKAAVQALSRDQDALRQKESQVRLEIATARNDMQVAKDRIAVTEAAIKQGEENQRINRERYQERVGTATEVLDAQTLLTQTKTDHYRALFDYQVAAARLKRAIGEL